ncbi:MAG: hypothetical protein KR126chlam3_01533 [Chlamydiae bacterium]|nr:hypothetical protein [Chlamydiota bacterium]
MKNEKKKVTGKSKKSKKSQRSTPEVPKNKGTKWQEFLRRHSQTQEKKS